MVSNREQIERELSGLEPSTIEELEQAVLAERCRRSFYFFVQTFWPLIIGEVPIWNWHIRYLCRVLQSSADRVFEREPKKNDIIINIPPGTTKSTICSIMFPIWVWTRDPSLRTICSSYSYELSLNLSMKSRDILKTPLYTALFPDIKIREDLDSKGHFGTTKGGERFSTSTTGTVTGIHGHFLIIDDPINPKGAVSDTILRDCNEWFDKTFSTRKVDKKVSVTFLIMQRLHESDLTQHLLDKEDLRIKHICLPCDDTWEVKPKTVKNRYILNGGLLDPVRLDRSVLKEQEVTLGPLEFAGQFGQSPRRGEGNLFLEEGVVYSSGITESIKKRVRYWDKAGTEGGVGPRTAGVRLALAHSGKIYVEDCVVGRWATHTREKTIRDTAEEDGIEVEVIVEQEPGSGGKESAEATIKNLIGFSAFADRPTGDKVVRAQPWSVHWNRGDVLILKADWNKEFIKEHLFFPKGRFKDIVDASSGAFASLTKKRKRGGVW